MIKKLNVPMPSEPVPEEYSKGRLKREKSVKDFEDLDLRRLPSLKFLMKDFMKKEKLVQLVQAMNHVLEIEELGVPNEAMKKEIVIYVMEEIEKFVLKPKAGSEKKAMAVDVLKVIFHNDEVITGITIDGLIKGIRQVGLIRRLALKTFRYFRKKSS